MNDSEFQALWHALNTANVEVVCARRQPLAERRERLATALQQARVAVVLLLEVLSQQSESPQESDEPEGFV